MLSKLVKSILAGVAISIGGTIFLTLRATNNVMGALMFSVGILMVMEFKLLLYTGYVPTSRESQKFGNYLLNTTGVFIGNLLGAMITALLISLTTVGDKLFDVATAVCNAKLGENFLGDGILLNLLSVFVLSIFCGIIIAAIVKATNLKHKVLYVAFMIAVFILCGFEHVVADAFYFALSLQLYTLEGIVFMIICMLGNFVGGFICSFVKTPEKN